MSNPQSTIFSERDTLFVDVVLPLALARTYTYRIPVDWNDRVQVGVRVIVQFGRNKIYSAVVKSISQEAPKHYEAKYILDIIDEKPIVNLAPVSYTHLTLPTKA